MDCFRRRSLSYGGQVVAALNDELSHLIQLSNSNQGASQHPRGTTCPSLA